MDFASKVLSARPGNTHIFSAGQAGFIVKSSSGQLLAIDMYLSDCVERLEGNFGFKRLLPKILTPSELEFDVVICTHPHFDHFDIDSVPAMMRHRTKLFCSVECRRLVQMLHMEYYGSRIEYVRPEDSFTAGDFRLSFVKCDHGESAPDAVGVAAEVDGITVYEAGDTCLRLDIAAELPKSPDVMIAPINGTFGNLSAEECSILAECLNPGVTIPCHYGMFAHQYGDLGRFYEVMTQKHLPFRIMGQGEVFTI
ncbi:MAG: MBL fold metallo-hydrolase [Synergistaceae bacterium]|nr:MBL fold metallo-hydrolase [Synergistaceae bacterium]